jgi:transposase InsO family protein
MVPSMSRPANPYDNASCESFMKTLKREEIYANQGVTPKQGINFVCRKRVVASLTYSKQTNAISESVRTEAELSCCFAVT